MKLFIQILSLCLLVSERMPVFSLNTQCKTVITTFNNHCLCNENSKITVCKIVGQGADIPSLLKIRNLVADEFHESFKIQLPDVNEELDTIRLDIKLESLQIRNVTLLFAKLAEKWKLLEIISIKIRNMSKLIPQEIERIPQIIQLSSMTTFYISDCFGDIKTDAILDLDSFNFAHIFKAVGLKNVEVLFSDPFRAAFSHSSSYYEVKKLKIANHTTNYLLTRQHEKFVWGVKEFYPTFLLDKTYADELESFYVEMYDGPKYLTKDMLYYVPKITSIYFGVILERIEYGTLVLGNSWLKLTQLVTDKGTVNMHKFGISFEAGDCHLIENLEICEICMMHQYGLHRVKDSVRKLCEAKKLPPNDLKLCYWRDPLPVPSSVEAHRIDQSSSQYGVEVCEEIPEDVRKFLSGVTELETNTTTPTQSGSVDATETPADTKSSENEGEPDSKKGFSTKLSPITAISLASILAIKI